MNLKQANPLLLIVDMQKVYDCGYAWECPNFRRAKDNIIRLMDSGCTSKIIATRFIAPSAPTGVWADYNKKYEDVNEDLVANELDFDIEEKVGLHNAAIIDKSTYSSYKHPVVKEKANTAPYVIVTGVTTGCCVLSTIMDLIDAGIYVVVIKDATAGSSIECEEAVWETLKGLAPLHLLMLDTDEYLRRIGNSSRL